MTQPGIAEIIQQLQEESRLYQPRAGRFYVYLSRQGELFELDSTAGLSEALEILEMVNGDCEWAAVQRLGRTVAFCREGVVTLVTGAILEALGTEVGLTED
jgi:hypothetical protein